MPDPIRYWIGVAAANHVRRGVADGFMQVCHGKLAPLARLKPGDGIIYYSPTETFGGRDRLQAFTALGRIVAGPVYPFDTGGGFAPFRRDVGWLPARTAPIRPLLDGLDLTRGKTGWGQVFRYGLVRISAEDFGRIATAMGLGADPLQAPVHIPEPAHAPESGGNRQPDLFGV